MHKNKCEKTYPLSCFLFYDVTSWRSELEARHVGIGEALAGCDHRKRKLLFFSDTILSSKDSSSGAGPMESSSLSSSPKEWRERESLSDCNTGVLIDSWLKEASTVAGIAITGGSRKGIN